MCVSTGNQLLDLVIVGGAVAAPGGLAATPALAAGATGAGSAAVAATYTASSVLAGLGTTATIAGALGSASSLGQQQASIPALPTPAIDITGSGGPNAPAVLAAEIKKANAPTPTAPVSSGATPASTGLQLVR